MLYMFFNFLHANNFHSLLHSHQQTAIINVPSKGVQIPKGVQSITIIFRICFMDFHILPVLVK